jgi:hypothetical protein
VVSQTSKFVQCIFNILILLAITDYRCVDRKKVGKLQCDMGVI